MIRASRLLSSAVLLFALSAAPGLAKIVSTAGIDCKTGRICFYWWPELPALKGWHTDLQVNYNTSDHGIYSIIPDGSTFASADVIIYGRAIYRRPLDAKLQTLDAFIASDGKQFRDEYRGDIFIAEAAPIPTGNGEKLRSVTYFSPKSHNWERVSFGQEGDYYLIFTLNAHSLRGYKAAQQTYESLLKMYKR